MFVTCLLRLYHRPTDCTVTAVCPSNSGKPEAPRVHPNCSSEAPRNEPIHTYIHADIHLICTPLSTSHTIESMKPFSPISLFTHCEPYSCLPLMHSIMCVNPWNLPHTSNLTPTPPPLPQQAWTYVHHWIHEAILTHHFVHSLWTLFLLLSLWSIL